MKKLSICIQSALKPTLIALISLKATSVPCIASNGNSILSSRVHTSSYLEAMFESPIVQTILLEESADEKWVAWLIESGTASNPGRKIYLSPLGRQFWLEKRVSETATIGAIDLDGDQSQELLIIDGVNLCSLGSPRKISNTTKCKHFYKFRSISIILAEPFKNSSVTFAAISLGRVALFGRSIDSHVEEVFGAELPTIPSVRNFGWTLENAPVYFFDNVSSSMIVTGPEEVGGSRLRTQIFVINNMDGSPSYTEAWSRRPEATTVVRRGYVDINGQVFLVEIILHSNKKSIFQKQQVAVYQLKPDRRHAGVNPLLIHPTQCDQFHRVDFSATDINSDLLEDLVVYCIGGFSARRVTIHGFLGTPDGSLAREDRVLSVRAPSKLIDSWLAGDVNGDDIPDLVTMTQSDLLFYFGSGPRLGIQPEHDFSIPLNSRLPLDTLGDPPTGVDSASSNESTSFFTLIPHSNEDGYWAVAVHRTLHNRKSFIFHLLTLPEFKQE